MDSRKLPIHTTPPLIGKLRHAYPLSILATTDAYLPWFHANYIQLFCPLARGFPQATVDFFYPPHYPSLPALDVQTLNRRMLGALGEGSLPDFVIHCLDADSYVQLYVDEFHIPRRAVYGRDHLIHKLLIFGYDRSETCFEVMGFLEDGRYAPSRVPFAQLEQAFTSQVLLTAVHAAEAGDRDPAHGDPGEIWLARLRPHKTCGFAVHGVVEQLTDYLDARNPAARFHMLDTSYYGQEGAGMEIYDCIHRRLEYSRHHPDFCDFLSLHILWEHKRCMRGRLSYLEEHHYLEHDKALSTDCQSLVDQARITRMMMLRFGMQRDVDVLPRIRERLHTLAGDERRLVERLVALLGD